MIKKERLKGKGKEELSEEEKEGITTMDIISDLSYLSKKTSDFCCSLGYDSNELLKVTTKAYLMSLIELLKPISSQWRFAES